MSDKSMADCKQRDCNYAMRAGCAPRLLTLFKFTVNDDDTLHQI